MLYVINGNEVEPLIQVSNFEMVQEVKGGFSVTLTTHNKDRKNPAYSLLKEESIVSVGDYEFRIKSLEENIFGKQITALNVFYDLVDIYKKDIYGGTRTFSDFVAFVLGGTGWGFTFDNSLNDHRLIENFGQNNVIALVNALCQVYQCEFMILPNNRIHFAKEISGDYDAQYRYGHNVKALSKNVDTTKLKTYIEGYGAESPNGGQLYVSYTSPYESIFGKREAEPVHDDRYMNADSLLEYLKTKLIDYPEVTFELDSIELLDKELGEKVWLIYEPLNIEFQTRILSQKKKLVNGKIVTASVVLGNTLPKNMSDILVSQKIEIDENKKITRSKFEQTNDRIEMEVEKVGESIANLKIEATQIEARVNNKIDQTEASLNIKADQINTSVNNRITNEVSTINQRADGIDFRVQNNAGNIANLSIGLNGLTSTVSSQGGQINGLGQRMGAAESSISQTAYQLQFKVSTTDFTGNRIVSMINQDAWSVSIDAQRINLNGATIVNGSITGSGEITGQTKINVGTDLTVGNNINMQGYGGNKITFADMTSIVSNGSGDLAFDLWGALTIQSYMTKFYGGVDFSNAYVSGLDASSVNGMRFALNSATWGNNPNKSGRLYLNSYQWCPVYSG